MSLLALLYIWGFMRSLGSLCIGIQTLIQALYTQLQIIYHSAAFSKSSGIAIYYLNRVIEQIVFTFLIIKSGGIS
jgi:hypothetical protein